MNILHVCRLINTGNIEQNVFFVKTQFLWFCNFFHKKFVKSKLVDFANCFYFSIAIFYKLNHKEGKKYIYDHFKNSGMPRYLFTRFWQYLLSADMLIANPRLAKLWRFTKMGWEVLPRNIKNCIFLTNLSHM